MVGTIVELGMQARHREAGEDTLDEVVAQALLNGRDEVARNSAADNGVFELEFDARLGWRELDPDIAELAMTAGTSS